MRIPPRPPPFTDQPPGSGDALGAAYVLAAKWLREGEWPTWEKVLHRSRAAGMAPETVWWWVRMQRETHLQLLDVADDRGRPFRLASGLVTLQPGLRELDLFLGGELSTGQEMAPADRDRVVMRSLQEEALRSSEIEGAVTTRQRARDLLTRGDRPRNRSETMVVNNFRALQYIQEHRAEAITLEHLLEMHALLVDGTLDDPDAVGRLRRADDEVLVVDAEYGEVLHTPPPAESLPERLERLLAFANASPDPAQASSEGAWLHPALRAIAVHFLLGWEHPFVDGNGRCARALWYWVMLRNRYWMAEFISISEAIGERKPSYYRAFLDTEQDGNDLTYFALMHLHVIRAAIARLRERLERHRKRMRGLQRELGDLSLNHRQKTLLAHALRRPGERYRFEAHARHHNVAYGTARSDLADLGARGLLLETREGRTRVFVAPGDLADRVAQLRQTP